MNYDICPACGGEGDTMDDLFRCIVCGGEGVIPLDEPAAIDTASTADAPGKDGTT